MLQQTSISISNQGRGSYEITRHVQDFVGNSHVETGLCHVFVHHTSASLMLCENADPTVRIDLENFMQRIAPDGDPAYAHSQEGPDDMPAHIRSVITQNGLTIPVTHGRCALGTWQGIYLWEHRTAPHRRTVTITVTG